MRILSGAVGVFLCASFVMGCGYSTSSLLPARYRSISVEPFENKVDFAVSTSSGRGTYVPLLETKVREGIINRYLFDGRLRIAASEQASLILRGELLSFDREELRLTDSDNVEEYRIRIVVALVLWDTAEGEIVWQVPRFAGEATYFITGPRATSEAAAIEEAITDLARRVVARTVENW